MLQTQFKGLRMAENEKIEDFHGKLRDLSNQIFQLGRPILEKDM